MATHFLHCAQENIFGESTNLITCPDLKIRRHEGANVVVVRQVGDYGSSGAAFCGAGSSEEILDASTNSSASRFDAMRCGDLKRAVEDVVLRPDENRIADLKKRGTIAALDLCQLDVAQTPSSSSSVAPSAAAMNTCSCSSEVVGPEHSDHESRPPPPLCASSSLDTIVNRPQPFSLRQSASGSRRQSRVYSNFQTKRKRSNSLTNYNKGQTLSVSLPPSARHTPLRFVNDEEAFRSSLGSSESYSSVARSEDYAPELVLEEDEVPGGMPELVVDVQPPFFLQQPRQHSACSSTSSNPFANYRERRDDDDDEQMDCD
ncbi:unnamed protein product [Caenorhabditis auriculariae]|uniref:Uncharacterized protein n=1 Tax=Caenorhabditis auriculariae TaxID=2777116 RepID=A0A8S1H6D6_9PELO|nr:unnamed protein product [Caenorhabditis auriculariae]